MAEFGFFGVVVYTRVQTPRRWGQLVKAGDLLLSTSFSRPFLTNCCTVGIRLFEIFCLRFSTLNVKTQFSLIFFGVANVKLLFKPPRGEKIFFFRKFKRMPYLAMPSLRSTSAPSFPRCFATFSI